MKPKNLKICGITSRKTACFCADAGVGAVGAVFYKPSPRYVSPAQARNLFCDLPSYVARVGVFVDLPPDTILAIAHKARLDTLQLHGQEPPETLSALLHSEFHVIKVLQSSGKKLLKQAAELPAQIGILVECGRGTLPGGNGAVWDWSRAAPLATVRPFALAGGLSAENIVTALCLSKATACDISSGVESAPGIKDHTAILKLVSRMEGLQNNVPFFWLREPS